MRQLRGIELTEAARKFCYEQMVLMKVLIAKNADY
jgi:hypothetical protein